MKQKMILKKRIKFLNGVKYAAAALIAAAFIFMLGSAGASDIGKVGLFPILIGLAVSFFTGYSAVVIIGYCEGEIKRINNVIIRRKSAHGAEIIDLSRHIA